MRSSTTRSNLCLLDRTRRSNYDRRLIVYLFSFLRIQLKPMRRYRRDLPDGFEKPSTSHADSMPYPHIVYWWKQNRNTSLSKRCFTIAFVLQEHRFVLSAWFVEQSAGLSIDDDDDESLDRTVDLPFSGLCSIVESVRAMRSYSAKLNRIAVDIDQDQHREQYA